MYNKSKKEMKPLIKFSKMLRRLLIPNVVGLESTSTDTESSNTKSTTSTLLTSGSCHLSCETLTYDIFLRIILGESLTLLIRSGVVPIEALSKVWSSILQEYVDLIKTDKSKSVHALWKKIEYTKRKIIVVDECCRFLKSKYDKDIAEVLATYGYDMIEWMQDYEKYRTQIHLVEMEAKNLVVLLNQYCIEYTQLNPDKAKAAAVRELADYEKELAILSRFMGYRIRKEELTVLEFCSIANNYLEYNKKK